MAQEDSVAAPFRTGEWVLAGLLALLVDAGIFVLFLVAGSSGSIAAAEEAPPPEVPIEVLPVIDDVPLLKLGSKRRENQLPDMWRKPKPKRLFEDRSAPAENAAKRLDKPLENEVAKKDEAPAPEDAELAKKVDEDIPEEEDPDNAQLPDEGSEQGVKEGTETDPLKAFVVSQYRVKLIAWFKAGFVLPNELDDEVLCQLLTRVRARVGSDRTVQSYELSPSGNPIFDARVKAHMDRKVGQSLPPPPPNYSDILETIVQPNFSGGERPACKKKKPRSVPGTPSPEAVEGDSPAPEAPAAEEPSPE